MKEILVGETWQFLSYTIYRSFSNGPYRNTMRLIDTFQTFVELKRRS